MDPGIGDSFWVSIIFGFHIKLGEHTLPETNIAPENRPLEKEITIIFRGENVSFREGTSIFQVH